jgi:glucose-1-phosphate adenylyltransferase
MDYDKMIAHHKKTRADVTIAVIPVPWEEASRFGIMNTDEDMRVNEFAEKPKEPKSNLASMGIYIFNKDVLHRYLQEDADKEDTSNDFGKDLIPAMLADGLNLQAYPFKGYWRDVGTIKSLWEASMDLIQNEPELNLNDKDWRIYSVNPTQPPQFISPEAKVKCSIVNEGCILFGEVDHSVISYGVQIGRDSLIKDSVIMPNAKIGKNVTIHRAIVGEGCVIEDGQTLGSPDSEDILLVGSYETMM